MKVKPTSTMIYSADFPFGGWFEIMFDRKQIWNVECVDYSPGMYCLRRQNVKLCMKTDDFKKNFEVVKE